MIPTRFLVILRVAFSLSLAVVLINGGFLAYDALRPGWLPKQTVGWGFGQRVADRLEALEYQISRRMLPPDQRVCAVLGLSTAGTGFSGEIMERADTLDMKYLILAGAGHDMTQLLSLIGPLRKGAWKPDLLVIGAHDSLLADGQIIDDSADSQAKAGSPRRSWRNWLSGALMEFWLVDRREDLNAEIKTRTHRLRSSLTMRFGLERSNARAMRMNPWADLPLEAYPLFGDDWASSPERIAPPGRFVAQTYARAAPVSDRFITGLKDLVRRGVPVLVVMMPEPSAIRDWMPPEASHAFADPLRRAFTPDQVDIVDLRGALPDEMFSDYAHYTREGRETLSRIVARILSDRYAAATTREAGTGS